MERFEDFVPRENVSFERYVFPSADQTRGVRFDQHLAELHSSLVVWETH